ncbi:hypothetical protein KJ853_04345 [Patescibacteria group bacterium]|nr:hypothetical protein [Patescibacteria group bacterium]
MIIVTPQNQITISDLKEMAEKMFGNLIKAAVDVEKGIMAVDGELHSDEELLLVEGGSKRPDVWGINLYPDFFGKEKFVEFDSMINIKPALGNRSRGVDDPKIKSKILEIVKKLVTD